MKAVLLIHFLFVPFLLFCQEPKKGDNIIVVKGVSFTKLKEILLDSGIFIDQQNENDGTIITKRKGYCNCPNKDFYQLIYYIRVKDSIATIRGQFSAAAQLKLIDNSPNTDDKDEFSEVKYSKSKATVYNYLFGIMIEFAKSLNGKEIEYKVN